MARLLMERGAIRSIGRGIMVVPFLLSQVGLHRCDCSYLQVTTSAWSEPGGKLETSGEALSSHREPPAELQSEESPPAQEPEPDGHPQRHREPISPPWRVKYVRLLGTLEIEVTDSSPGGQSGESSILELSGVQGFGPLARAACIALVLNLRNGRSPGQLGLAMEGIPRAPSALHSHISAVRRTGLRVDHKSTVYRIENLSRSQVDALRFEDLHREMRELRANRGDAGDAELIAKAAEALRLWAGDPVAAHEYFREPLVLERYSGWLTAIQFWYADALVRRGEPDDIETAERQAEQIQARNASFRGLSELRDLIRAARGEQDHDSAANTVPVNASPSTWLQSYQQCLAELVSAVDLRGYNSQTLSSFSLAAYTPLYAKPRTQERPPPGQRTGAGRPLLETVVSGTRANLVIGDSGSGKSTFLAYLCTSYLASGQSGIPLYVDLVSSPAISEARLDRQDRLPWQILPELFSLRFADLGVDVSVPELDELARTVPVVWLVDGLNEVAPPEVRFALAEAISVCARRWPKAKFVLTSTETGLSGYGTPPGFQRVDVDAFRPEDVDHFLDAFCRDRYPGLTEQELRDRWEPLASVVRESAELRGPARSPLLLTAMTIAYLDTGRLPDSRADLLRGAVEWHISQKQRLLRDYVRSSRDVRVIFSELAFQMMTRQETPQSRVGIGWAADCLRPLECYRGDVRDFLDTAVSAGCLLMRRGPGDIGIHEAFRDYLAASRIAAKTDDPGDGWWSELAPHLDDPEWHSVVALVPGELLLLGGSERVDLFFDLLGASCADQALVVRAGRVALGGGILRELGWSGYRLSGAPQWAAAVRSMRELLDHPGDVPVYVRYGAAAAYGVMGDERLADLENNWIPIPAGRFWMGAQAQTPTERNYDADAAPWESPVTLTEIGAFAIRRFPVTVSEYQEFVQSGGYHTDGEKYWTTAGRRWRSRAAASAPVDWDLQLSVPNAPVAGVSWHECVAYCNWLTGQGAGEYACRLPYEREWEYAAKRDITSTQFRWGDRMHAGDDAEANWAGAFLRRKSPVGIFPASTTADGVGDLFGNVEEWCLDAWEDASLDRQEHDSTALVRKRVVRGGSCIRFSRLCRPTYRSRIEEDQRYLSVGFRPVRVTVHTADAGMQS
jgi:formylglycine-generating enzyme required for sulfatase activity